MTGGLGSNVGSACQLTMVLVVQGAQLWFGALVRGAFTSGAQRLLGCGLLLPEHCPLWTCPAYPAVSR